MNIQNFQKPKQNSEPGKIYVIFRGSLSTIDDILWIDFSEAILNEAFRSPDHKTFF